jgi:uncharacterized protein (TIGR02145 family)
MNKVHSKGVAGYAQTVAAGFLLALVFTFTGCEEKKNAPAATDGIKSSPMHTSIATESGIKTCGYKSPEAAIESKFTDTRDGKQYKTVRICEQTWMAENLNYEAEGSKCYNDSISYCNKYGRLYDWNTAMKACPKGWHLPSKEEWDKLYRYADGDKGTESPYKSETAGKYLKSKEGWNNDEGKSCNGEDTYGFSALPGAMAAVPVAIS